MRAVVPRTVYLTGAGPGSPDLITVRGLQILQHAEVVLHDTLLSPELLAECRTDATVISVGKRGYCIGSTKQETIHEAMVRFAKEGRSVCRLKCGDPCLFGRGGEEAQYLAANNIPFEIVPGVSSAFGACAAAAIPLTHRDVGQSVTFVAGHHDPISPGCTLDWEALARLPVCVYYMATRHIARIADRLIDAGQSPTTAAAIIESGTLPNQRITVGELEGIGRQAERARITAPAVFVVGEVVRYREELLGLISRPSSIAQTTRDSNEFAFAGVPA